MATVKDPTATTSAQLPRLWPKWVLIAAGGIGVGLGRDLHAGCVHFAQLQASLQQRGQLPAQVDAGDFNIQAGAAPAQPANAPAAAQRA